MITASELRAGMVIRLENETYRVLEATAHAGTAKLGGSVHARLLKLGTGSESDRRFRLEEKVEDLDLVKRHLEFSYKSGEEFYFMDRENFEQVPLPRYLIGEAHRFLRDGMRLPVEFLGEEPVKVVFPETVDLRVTSTPQPMHATQTSTMKSAALENGMEVLVPLFIKEGELVRINLASGRYVERVREGRR
ncbi:MAG: elongation factor P [Acidobacteria bacterium]|nr:elongation factor P [Acidobacteriota bacterium]